MTQDQLLGLVLVISCLVTLCLLVAEAERLDALKHRKPLYQKDLEQKTGIPSEKLDK